MGRAGLLLQSVVLLFIGMSAMVHAESVRPADELRCFGAAGHGCNPMTGFAQLGYCVGNRCPVSGGSWEHDECCWEYKYKKKSPKSCIAPHPNMPAGTGPAQVCNSAWVKALARTAGGWNWWRVVDTGVVNTDGKVVFAAYCAQTGSRVHKSDVKYCCSQQATLSDADDSPDARICR